MAHGTTRRLAGIFAGLPPAVLWALYVIQPPMPAGTNLDQSWRIGITMATKAHMVFGRDIVFTYGPLGYVLQGIPDVTLAASALSIMVAMVAIAVLGFWLLFRGSSWLQKIVLAVVLVIFSSLQPVDYVLLAGIVALLVRGGRFPRLAPLVGGCAGAVALFGILSKYTLGVDVLAAAGTVWIVDVVSGPATRRRAAALNAAGAAGIIALGIAAAAASGRISVASYLRTAAEISSGYSAAMVSVGPNREVAFALAIGAAIVAFALLARRERKYSFAPLSIVVLFLAWKHGFVRQDPHIILYFGTAAMLVAILLAGVRRPLTRVVGLGVTVVALFSFIWAYDSQLHTDAPPLFDAKRLAIGARYVVAPLATNARLAELANLAPDRLPQRLRATLERKTVDAVPIETAVIAANGLRWKPLPVFQAYTAYTPALDRLNRDALVADGAEAIVYEYNAIDDRLPFGEMPATTRELVCRYRPTTRIWTMLPPHGFLAIYRSPGARCDETPAGAAALPEMNRPIDVPEPASNAEFIVATFDIRPTLLAKLRTVLWRSPVVHIDILFDDKTIQRYRAVTATLGDGVIISPTPRGLAETSDFLLGGPAHHVRTITLVGRSSAFVLHAVTFTRVRRT